MKTISPETKKQIISDIKEKYFNGYASQREIGLEYNVSNTTMKGLADIALKEMSEEIRVKKENIEKEHSSENQASKYGIPQEDKFLI